MAITPSVSIKHLGCAGHLIVSSSCLWHRHTQVDGPGGSWRVSTIGNYYVGGKRKTIGAADDSWFETMVFVAAASGEEEGAEGCGCRPLQSLSEIYGERYATAGAAQEGHEAAVAKFAKLARSKKADDAGRRS